MKSTIIGSLIALFGLTMSAIADETQDSGALAGSEPSLASSAIDPVDLENFLDGLIKAGIEAHGVAGATISVVHDGKVILAKGYGYADIAAGKRVEADKTSFRVGSISKTFTWTAVMQLVEQGKLDLNADLRSYVDDVQLPDAFGKPVTMAHLMSHTPGLEASTLGHLFTDDPDKLLTVQEYLAAYPREQIWSPGERRAYSNYGSTLAGHVVAKVSGLSFEDYIDRNILQPLGMDNSTFREPWGTRFSDPMPEFLFQNTSKGYARRNGRFEEGPWVYIHQVGPAGALSATATDMARYMLMHLGDGSYDGAQVLETGTARRMHRESWSPNEGTKGFAHGFFVFDIAGYPAYGHGGGTMHFVSNMILIPELNLGVFFSFNGIGGARMRDLTSQIVKQFFEDRTAPPPGPIDGFNERAEKIVGNYLSNQRSYSVVESLIEAPRSVLSVSLADENHLIFDGGGPEVQRWVEVNPYVFRHAEGTNMVQFDVNDNGEVIGVPVSLPARYYTKIGMFENPNFKLQLVGLAILVFAAALTGAWLRRELAPEQSSVGEKRAAVATISMSGLWVTWFVVLAISIVSYLGDPAGPVFDFPSTTFIGALTVGLAATLATIAALILLVPVWRDGNWSRWRQVRHTFVVALGLITVLVLNGFNAIGYHYY